VGSHSDYYQLDWKLDKYNKSNAAAGDIKKYLITLRENMTVYLVLKNFNTTYHRVKQKYFNT